MKAATSVWKSRPAGVVLAASVLLLAAVPRGAPALDPPHDLTNLPNYCGDCHTPHGAAGPALTTASQNATLCISCHTLRGGPGIDAWLSADQANPAGATGSSHSWDKAAANATYGASTPANAEMAKRIYGGNLSCSACHDQHSQANQPNDPNAPAQGAGRHFQRIADSSNEMCVDCHASWKQSTTDERTYTGSNRSHPVLAKDNNATPTPLTLWQAGTGDGTVPDPTYKETPHDVPLKATVASATYGAGVVTITADATKHKWAANAFGNLFFVRFTGGAFKNVPVRIASNAANTLTLETNALPAAPAASDSFEIDRVVYNVGWDIATGGAANALVVSGRNWPTSGNSSPAGATVTILATPAAASGDVGKTCAVSSNTATQLNLGACTPSALGNTPAANWVFLVNWKQGYSGTVTAASGVGATAFTDTAKTLWNQADQVVGLQVRFTKTNQGGRITAWNQATQTATFTPALAMAVSIGDAYRLEPAQVGPYAGAAAAAGTTTTLSVSGTPWTGVTLKNLLLRFTRTATSSSANDGMVTRITASTASTLTFAAVSAAVAANDVFEIDLDGNASNSAALAGATPSFSWPSGKVACLSCHGVHYADSDASTYDDRPRTGDGKLLRRGWVAGGASGNDEACQACHATKIHSSVNTSSKYGPWGLGVAGLSGNGSQLHTCGTCHLPHQTTNIFLVRPTINGTAVSFQNTTGVAANSFATGTGSGPCEVCHTQTTYARNTGGAWAHETTACTGCHTHATGFAGAGESSGGKDCNACHASIFNPMNATSGSYHHFMYRAWSGTTAGSGTTVYPTVPPTSSQTDINRRCVMCHVDHNIFRPDLNANAGRGMNLRTAIGDAVSTSAGFTNTDFDDALAAGGICLSCHSSAQTKAYTQPDGTTTTPAVAKADYAASAHNYAPQATFKTGGVAGGSTFNANCSKCHNDTLTKAAYQTSTNKFGLHDSAVPNMTAPMGDTVVTGTATGVGQSTTALVDTSKTWTSGQFDGYAVSLYDAANGRRTAVVKSTAAPSTLSFLSAVSAAPVDGTTTYALDDPQEERLCLQCHSGGAAGNDWYNVQAMSQAAKRLDQFGKFYAAGTITTTAGSISVTGASTIWIKASGASGVTFTNGSNLVNGTGTSFDASMVGWSIRNTGFTPITWYSIVRVVSATQLVISPPYAEPTAASAAWRIAPGDWYLKAAADANGIWYRVRDVTTNTALTVYPAFPAAYASSSYVLRSSPGHPLAGTAGQHRVYESTASGWNGGTARHVTCADCHSPHSAQAGNHAPGSTVPGLGGANLGAAGVAVSYPPDKSGTATFTNASATVTWTGGSFGAGDVGKNITGPDSVTYLITAFTSATQVTIQPAYKGTTATAAFTVKNPSARTGRATFTRNSATVTWVSGPAWSSADAGKTLIGPDGFNYAITAATTTTLTISPNYRGENSPTTANGGGAPWTIKDPAKTATGDFTNGGATVSSSAFAASDVGRYVSAPDARTYLVTAVSAGVSATISPAYQGTTITGAGFTVANLGYAAVASLAATDMQASLCLRCHSAFAYGSSQPGANIFAYNTSGTLGTSNTQVGVGMAAGQSDVAEDFNPGQLAHHAVMGPGRNQPPDTANANWTSSAGRKATTYVNAQGQTVPNPAAGLDNTFVDGWGKSSRVACTDCHASESAEDPWGPHGSANQWVLKGIDPTVTVTRAGNVKTFPNRCYYKGASTSADAGVPNTGDIKNLCLNCHRADVYGLVTSGGDATGTSCDGIDQTTQVIPILYGNLSRVTHPVDDNPESNSVADGALTRFGIYCLQCHGGEGLGAIHGTNALRGPNGTSFRGKRFLAGATWFGHTRASTTVAVRCWTKNDHDTVNTCTQGHGGSNGRLANYDYDSGAD